MIVFAISLFIMSFSIQNILLNIQWLIGLGPRPHQSHALQYASIGISEKMKEAGWDMKTINLKGNIIGCKGKGHILFLAHQDTVPGSPGAVDNAAAVAALLELATAQDHTDICIGFPVGEEIGLVGSQQMTSFIYQWHPSPTDLRLVVSLELIGNGSLWVSGLTHAWDSSQLDWLMQTPHLQSEYGYQMVSRIVPTMERSDHRSFQKLDIPTIMLLSRDENGIFPNYHQPTDIVVKEDTLLPLMEALDSISTRTFPHREKPLPSSSTLLLYGLSIPSSMVWAVNILGLIFAGLEIRRWKETFFTFLKGVGVWTIAALVIYALSSFSLFSPTLPEQTAQNIFGLSASGWWNAAPIVTIFGLVFFMAIHMLLRRKKGQGSAALLAGAFSIPLLILDPFLAFPMAVATILSRWWAPFAALGMLYWIQPGILRELSFHGLLPPHLWGILFVFLIPILGVSNVRNRTANQTGQKNPREDSSQQKKQTSASEYT